MLEFTEHAPKIAVITGAGRGLGRELALALVARGLQVAALGRTMADLEALASEAGSGKVLPVQADVADANNLRTAFTTVQDTLGPVDILINNAAVYPHLDFLDETPETFAQTLNINLCGMATCAMLALQQMVPRGVGRIINLTSFAGRNPAHLSSAYSVSKGGARILTSAMTTDLSDRFPGIVINEWIPGALNTDMGIPEGHDPAEAARWGAALAMCHDPELNGRIFVENIEMMPQLSLKRRIFNKVTGRQPTPFSLEGR